MIPKVIHYCWFGGELTDNAKRCIDSWRKVMPDYEIICHSEGDVDMTLDYNREKMEKGEYAFLSDSVRMRVLYEEGGIYLDTDMLMVKPFDLDMLCADMFLGSENGSVVATCVIGCIPHHWLIGEMIEYYKHFEEGGKQPENSKVITRLLERKMMLVSLGRELITLENTRIYPAETFCPISYFSYEEPRFSDRTYGVHEWGSSAVSPDDPYLGHLADSFRKSRFAIREFYANNGEDSTMLLDRFGIGGFEIDPDVLVAVDFDGTLTTWDEFPKQHYEMNEEAVNSCKEMQEAGAKLILWTCRNGEPLREATESLGKCGLKFDYVNEGNGHRFDSKRRKVNADLYIDDKANDGSIDWPAMVGKVRQMVTDRRKDVLR